MSEQLTIEQMADVAWRDYSHGGADLDMREKLDSLSDDHYYLCEDIFTEGFKAGIAHILTQGKPNES